MKDRAMKNKKLYYMCFCAALVGSLQTVYGQTEDEVVSGNRQEGNG